MLYKLTHWAYSMNSSTRLRKIILRGSKVGTNCCVLHVCRCCITLRTLLNNIFTCKSHHFRRTTLLETTSLITSKSQTWQLRCVLSLDLRVLILQMFWYIRALSVRQITIQITIGVIEMTSKIAAVSLFVNRLLNFNSVLYCGYWCWTRRLHHLIFNWRCPNHFRLECWSETATNWLLTAGCFCKHNISFSPRRHHKTISIGILKFLNPMLILAHWVAFVEVPSSWHMYFGTARTTLLTCNSVLDLLNCLHLIF